MCLRWHLSRHSRCSGAMFPWKWTTPSMVVHCHCTIKHGLHNLFRFGQFILPYHARIQGGAKGALAPPPPHKILLPQIVRRGPRGPWPPPPGGQEGLGPPPYKILDPPMHIEGRVARFTSSLNATCMAAINLDGITCSFCVGN